VDNVISKTEISNQKSENNINNKEKLNYPSDNNENNKHIKVLCEEVKNEVQY